jgi:hypothetical protein
MGWLTEIVARIIGSRQSAPIAPLDLETTGRHAIEIAAARWSLGVFDPRRTDRSANAEKSRNQIDGYIGDGLGWTWERPYQGDGDFEWCGAFAATCWLPVRADLRRTYFASTYRLDRYARYQSVNGERNKGTGRLIAELDENTENVGSHIVTHRNGRTRSIEWSPRAGDILLIGPTGSGYGKHICLVESYADGVFQTIEGNGTGRAPNGQRWQGVVRAERYLGKAPRPPYSRHALDWHARRLIRPSVEDLAP